MTLTFLSHSLYFAVCFLLSQVAIGCFQACTELRVFSWGYPEGLYVRTQMSKSVAPDTLQSFSWQPLSENLQRMSEWARVRTQQEIRFCSCLVLVLMCGKQKQMISTAEWIHHVLPPVFSSQPQLLAWTLCRFSCWVWTLSGVHVWKQQGGKERRSIMIFEILIQLITRS